MEDNTDKLARAYSVLAALRKNIPTEYYYVKEHYVTEYHKALDNLAQLGCDVQEFKIPEQWMKLETWQVPAGEGYETRHSNTRQVEMEGFMMKLDSVLNYLSSLASAKDQRRIGFTGGKE